MTTNISETEFGASNAQNAGEKFAYFFNKIALNPLPFMSFLLLSGFGLFVLVFRDITFVPGGRLFRKVSRQASGAIGASISSHLASIAKWRDHLGWIANLIALVAPLIFCVFLMISILRELF